MRRYLLPIVLCGAFAAHAQTPSWHEDISCIVFTHCTPCHHDGGAAHFGLTDYQEAHWWRNEMLSAVQSRYMPPWPPDPAYRSFAHERVLTQEEIDLIAAWVVGGAPEGDPQFALPLPTYDDGWEIDDPDLSLIMDDFMIPSSANDLYRCFVMPTGLSLEKYITGLEVVPGNTSMVHHVLVYQDNTGQAAQLDAQDPTPGYTSFGGIGVPSAKLIGAWVPGQRAFSTPQGMGIRLLANSDVVIQVHYPATSSSTQVDSTRVNMRFSSQPGLRNLSIDPILYHAAPVLLNGPLVIPANQVRTFDQRYTAPFPVTITSIAPHAHLICVSMKSFAVLPNGDTIPLIDIPDWDFAWQGSYHFRRPVHLPAGTQVHGMATYDNTANNPRNPNNPPQLVTLGEATTDEMMLFYFSYTTGTWADTLIVVDDSPHADHYLDCVPGSFTSTPELHAAPPLRVWPTPAGTLLHIDAGAPDTRLRLIDATGRTVVEQRATGGTHRMDIARLARGHYVLEALAPGSGRPQRLKVLLE